MPILALTGFFLLSGAINALPIHAQAPTPPDYTVTLTGYNAVPAQTDDDPLVTASGAYANPEVIAARSRDLADALPFGTIIEIHGPTTAQHTCGYGIVSPLIGYRVVADAMNARYSNRVDVLFSTKSRYTLADGRVRNAGTVLGICNQVTLRVVGHIGSTHLSAFPASQAELAALVDGTALALK